VGSVPAKSGHDESESRLGSISRDEDVEEVIIDLGILSGQKNTPLELALNKGVGHVRPKLIRVT
jgi:hypothetical protein